MLAVSRDLPINARIIVGFVAVLVCLVAIGGSGILALAIADSHLGLLRETSVANINAVELEREVVDLQRCVQAYSYTGRESMEVSVKTLIDRVENKIDHIAVLTDTSDQALVERMQEHLDVYKETFELVREERRIRRELVSTKISVIRDAITPYLETPSEEETPSHKRIVAAFIDAERELFRYLYDPTHDQVMKSLRALNLASNEPDAVDSPMRDLLVDYRKTANRIVQATRSYLYLTGVVMAGEAHEFAFASQELKRKMLERNEETTRHLMASSRKISTATAALSSVAVLLGGFLSYVIARSISTPIKRITETFQALARGEDATDIPGSERKDEIGTLAAAADVFRQKNKQTEHLLQVSESMATELQTKILELDTTNRELDQFVYTVSHDLKSPVVTAVGFIGMINQLVEEGEVEQALAKLPRVEKATERMSELISDLLDLTRIGRTDTNLEPTPLDEVFASLADIFESRLEQNGVTLSIEPGLPTINGNTSRVRQVFENLIGNAIKYGKCESGTRIDVTWLDTANETLVCVADNGQGIRREHHDKVFALFQRLDTGNDGTGVGLSVVQKIMKTHGGRVWLESEGTGDGCRFWLAFPKPQTYESGDFCRLRHADLPSTLAIPV